MGKKQLIRHTISALMAFGLTVFAFAQQPTQNSFSIARIRWDGGGGGFFGPQWAHDYPVSEENLMFQLRQVTTIRLTKEAQIVELDDPELFTYPFGYMCEVQDCVLSDEEVRGLREYLLRGGFLLIDDAWTDEGLERFSRELKKVFPNRSIERIGMDHPIYHTFYSITDIPAIQPGFRRRLTAPAAYGLSDDSGRLMMLLNWNNDVSDGWEWAAVDHETGVSAYKLGINYILYAMSH